MNDSDYNGITRNDIMRLVNSRYRIIWKFKCYTIRDVRQNQMVAIDFDTWVDALVFLLEDMKVI